MNINSCFEYLHIGMPDDISKLKHFGDFQGAIELIDGKLKTGKLPHPMQISLTVQREIMARLPENYIYTKEQALARVRDRIPDFSESEFDKMERENRIGWIYIQGVPHYFYRFYENLIRTDTSFAKRVGEWSGAENHLDRTISMIKERGSVTNRIRVRASVRMKDEYFNPDEFVRVHLPIPCTCPQQSDIYIERLEPPGGQLAPENSPQRTVCWEESMLENHSFLVEYSYLHTTRYHNVSSIIPSLVEPSFDTEEQPPHIIFTPYIQALTQSLTAGLESPLDKARAIYDFITLNIKYSFMPSYFCLENIAESCARNLIGDCGVMALLFITLCRCARIPARWQSGLITRPDFCGAHDWAMFYVEPYGWLYTDPSFGTSAVREGNEDRRRFFFGNLDPYRMVANTKLQAGFSVPKEHWRADPYDNQVGEMETSHRGLHYFEYENDQQVINCIKI